MGIEFWIGGQYGEWSNFSDWYPGVVPSPGDLAIDQSGQITASNIGIDNTTIWLDYNENEPVGPRSGSSSPVSLSLIGSSLGSASKILLNSDMGHDTIEFSNSALHGSIFAASGSSFEMVDAGSSAVNYGSISVANTYNPTTDTLVAFGSFANNGIIEAGANAQFGLIFGLDSTQYQYIFNSGIIQGDPGGSIALNASQSGTTSFGAIVNTDQIKANGASVYVNADLLQSPGASVVISGNGSVTLSGQTTGGIIQIDSGSLNFVDNPSFIGSSYAAKAFTSQVDFTGETGTITFGNENIQEEFRPATKELYVTTEFGGQALPVADLHLGGPASYGVGDFAVQGNTLTYTSHSS